MRIKVIAVRSSRHSWEYRANCGVMVYALISARRRKWMERRARLASLHAIWAMQKAADEYLNSPDAHYYPFGALRPTLFTELFEEYRRNHAY